MEHGNPIAERRRQRKLENQRLEEEARRRHEELLLLQERERQRIENERIVEERRKLEEREARRRRELAEADRIASIERQERQLILRIEKKLKLLGSFCTASVKFPSCSSDSFPTCVTVMSRTTIETATEGSVVDDIVFVADSSATLYALPRKSEQFVVSAALRLPQGISIGTPVSMSATRSGVLLVFVQGRVGFCIVRVRELFQTYNSVEGFLDLNHHPISVGNLVAAWIPLASSGIHVNGTAFDDTSGDLYQCDQANHQIAVFSLTSVSGLTNDYSNNVMRSAGCLDNGICIDRTFGRLGSGKGELKKPTSLAISHYHVAVCDAGNTQIVMFTKRGGFVKSIGCKGRGPGQFMDPRDVKLANVRKRALSRGLVADDNSISNEQFDMIVADTGCFRVQILDENGNFMQQLSLLTGPEQIEFQHDRLGLLHAAFLREYAIIKTQAPVLLGDDLKPLYKLSSAIHPTSSSYASVTTASHQWRTLRSRYHHPSAADFLPSSRELAVVDTSNGCLHFYSLDGSRCLWSSVSPLSTMMSVHSCLQIEYASRFLYCISDPLANRVAVMDHSSLTVERLIGASSYGDQNQCSPGYLPGQLNHPTYLAVYHAYSNSLAILLVSDTGNHYVSLFHATDGEYYGRIGNGFGHTEGYLDSPQGLAVLDNQTLFVVDQRNHRVQVFDLQESASPGRLLRVFGSFGTNAAQFNLPTAIAVCAALPSTPPCDFGPHRGAKLAVADTGNCRIQVLDLNGVPHFVIAVDQTPQDLPLMPLGIWIEQRSGYLLVCDGANQCVLIFRNDGSYASSIGAGLESTNRFARPINVVIQQQTQDHEFVLITDGERQQVCKFIMNEVPIAK